MNQNNNYAQTRPAVRVGAAPGGNSTFTLAHDSTPQNNNFQPSVRVKQQQSQFSLAWDDTPSQNANKQTQQQVQTSVKVSNAPGGQQGFQIGQQENNTGKQQQVKTSVYVKNPPGGRSQIQFG